MVGNPIAVTSSLDNGTQDHFLDLSAFIRPNLAPSWSQPKDKPAVDIPLQL
jgi:hypothetical protein